MSGRYILSARLLAPNEQRLFDEYEFTHESGPVPPAEAPAVVVRFKAM